MSGATLLAGAARQDISPPDGIRTAGFSSRENVVNGVDEPLSVTALVLEGQGARVCIAALDLCMVPQDVALEWREAVGAAVGTPASHVLLNLSHTHSGAALLRTQPEFAAQADLLLAYQARLVGQLVAAATEAVGSLRPARIGAGSGTSTIGVQRRERDTDGSIFLGEVPDGPIDPVVSVVRVDDLDGRVIAILAAYGCHTVAVGPRATVASPDFPGPMRRLVEDTFGGLCLFLQGGGGDIMPCWGMSHEVDATDAKERVGQMLGGEVVRVAAGIHTNVRRGERVSMPSLLGSGMTLRPWVPVDGPTCTAMGAVSTTVALDLVPLPSAAEAADIRAARVADLERAVAGDSDRAVTVARRQAAWADELIVAVGRGDRARPMEVQAIRVNGIMFTAIAAEVFSATTQAIRDASPFAHTVALGYSNGVLCYLPTEGDYPEGGWDVHARYRIPDLVFQAYLLPVAIAPDSEARVRAAVIRVMAALADDALAAPSVSGGRSR